MSKRTNRICKLFQNVIFFTVLLLQLSFSNSFASADGTEHIPDSFPSISYAQDCHTLEIDHDYLRSCANVKLISETERHVQLATEPQLWGDNV